MQQLLEAAFYQSQLPQCLLDNSGHLLAANAAYSQLLGKTELAMKGKIGAIIDPETLNPSLLEAINDSLRETGIWSGEVHLAIDAANDCPVWVNLTQLEVELGHVTLAQLLDISERKSADLLVHRLAYFDPVTRLPNNTLLKDRMVQAVASAKRYQQLLALVMIDIDDSSELRDQLGSNLFNQMLVETSAKLRDNVRADDTIASLGNGRFSLLMTNLSDKNQALAAFTYVAEKLHQCMAQALPQLPQGVTLCMGAALYPLDGDDQDELTDHSEIALHQAKRKGNGQTLLFTPALQQQAIAQQQKALEIQRAIVNKEFRLLYQPVLDADSGEVATVEALIRWQHPDKGLLLPKDFLQVADTIGAMRPIGDWVLDEVATQIGLWRQRGPLPSHIAINLSVKQFQSKQLVAMIREWLDKTQLKPEQLQLEITEQALQSPNALDKLKALKKLGASITLDDFGAGFSSIKLLQQAPIDSLKIDRSFAQQLPHEDAIATMKSIVELARSIGFRVVITGIESPMQLEIAQRLECSEVQGFLLREPVPGSEFHF